MTYGSVPTDFAVGDRVELHPGTDLWARGARYGTIIKILPRVVKVRLDVDPARIGRFFWPHDLRKVT
jgi:hypothetical protein